MKHVKYLGNIRIICFTLAGTASGVFQKARYLQLNVQILNKTFNFFENSTTETYSVQLLDAEKKLRSINIEQKIIVYQNLHKSLDIL